MKRILINIGIIVFLLVAAIVIRNMFFTNEDDIDNDNPIKYNVNEGSNTNFEYKIIKEANKGYKTNYMISPLSMAYALSILREGASNNTKTELDNVIEDYSLLSLVNVKDRISLANALFIKEKEKKAIKESYTNKIKNNYGAEILFDEFKTPDKINNWVSKKTFKMIDSVLDEIDPNFVLGIVNAIAIDVKWKKTFECSQTTKDTFTLKDGTEFDSAFMHSDSNLSYFEINGAKGIIKDYETYDYLTGNSYSNIDSNYDKNNTVELEYIAILPDNLDEFINNFSINTLSDIYKNINTKDKINLALPKYTYDFTYDNFKKDLKNLGIKDAFDDRNASFENITGDNSLYVDKAVHKSFIDLNEYGTKAAAVTAITLNYKSAIDQRKVINISFDKPFIYLIKEKKSNNIWFFGTVYEPIKWENHKCETKEFE